MEMEYEYPLDTLKGWLRDLVTQYQDTGRKIREVKRFLTYLQAEHKRIEEEMIELDDFINEIEKDDK